MADAYIEEMWQHPPRCITSVAAHAQDTLVKAIQQDYGEYTTVFSLRCPCGQSQYRILKATTADGGLVRLAIHCDECAQESTVFDPASDGYDGEFGHTPAQEPENQTQVQCTACRASDVSLVVGFQYSGDNEELDDPELIKRKQDFFSWFVARAICAGCSEQNEIISYECA